MERAEFLLEPQEMAQADRLTIVGGTPGFALMENAGFGVANVVCRHFTQGARAVVLAGIGNNGGDGFIAAEVLKRRGFIVKVALALPAGRTAADISGDAARAFAGYRGDVEPAAAGSFGGADLIVDALYGAGLSRDIEGRDAELVAAVNAARREGARVYAVDLPSGIDGRTGAVRGVAVEADETVTFFRRKPGHLLMPGRRHAGRVRLVDIGIKPAVLEKIAPSAFANGPELWRGAWPAARAEQHKYGRGAALVASGPAHSSGAAKLAAEAALRAGAGIVTVACPPEAVLAIAAYRAALVIKPFADAAGFAALVDEPRLRAAVLGPGMGVTEESAAAIAHALAGAVPLVLDADALTLAAGDRSPVFAAIAARAGAVVMTPHEGEFARLFPDLSGSKLERARAAARLSGAVVLLKGPDTVIARPDGRAAINENAPPELATAGSGDVLAGIIAGLLASGAPAFEAAAMGAWIHGEAGRIAGPGAIADDIAASLRPVIAAGCPAPEAEEDGEAAA